MTTIAGVFAAGDVADPYYRQAITAAADGSRAAMDVRRWLERQKAEHPFFAPTSLPALCC
jgi:thioredoxin reductase (NADPH)